MRQGKSRRISITIFIISIGSRIYGNRGSGVAVASSSFQRNGRGRTPAAVSLKPTRPAQRADGNQNRDPASESARSQSRYLRPTPARMVPPVPEIPIRLRLWSRIAADIDRL